MIVHTFETCYTFNWIASSPKPIRLLMLSMLLKRHLTLSIPNRWTLLNGAACWAINFVRALKASCLPSYVKARLGVACMVVIVADVAVDMGIIMDRIMDISHLPYVVSLHF